MGLCVFDVIPHERLYSTARFRREGFVMLSGEFVRELRSSWLPNVTDTGLERVIELLDKQSPLLVFGRFTGAVPMGCLASHFGWHHPQVAHRTTDAGILWLTRVAGLNPATSQVILSWDHCGPRDWTFRAELSQLLKDEREARHGRECCLAG
ncbi:MAG: hypothetical protein ACJ8C4_03505 [Gemmataceae bacterium]